MMRILSPIYQLLRRFRRNEKGSASIEFVILLPIFMTIFTSSFESGLLMTKYMMFERALDMAVRDIRMSDGTDITHDSIKEAICDEALLFKDCEDVLLLEMESVDLNGTITALTPNCVDRSSDVDPVVSFTPGTESEVMFLTACIIVDPLFPGAGLGLALTKDGTGGYAMIATSAFVNEPN